MIAENTLFTDALGLNTSHSSLLTAIGNQAFILNGNSNLCLSREMHYKKVHGFAMSHECRLTRLLLLYAENEFSLFRYETTQKEIFKLTYEGATKDWINAATFLKDEKGYQFVLHTAHSALLRLQYYDAKNNSGECVILELACCTDYSMIYHTSLHGNCFKKLLMISGNGCGEILIWQSNSPINFNTTTCLKIYEPLMRLKAHNGVIFSIDFNLTSRLLVTTSDDRSLKFWQLESLSTPDLKWDVVSLKPLFSCFGHTARVMCAIIVEYDGQIFVISGGEDSYICVWSQTGDMLFKRRQQFGAPIWRLGFDPATATLYSTGSTGNVLAYNLKNILSGKQTHSTRLIQLDSSTEFMKRIKYLNSSTIIALSNKNNLFYMNFSESHKKQIWKSISDFPAYKCTVLAVYNEIIATCGYQRVTLINYNIDTNQFERLYDGAQLEGLIQSFHFLSKERFLISDEYGNCLILKGLNMDVEGSMKIKNSREPWITAALLVSPNCLLLSSRNGHVMLYTREGSVHLQLKNTVKRLHGSMGCTILQLLKTDAKYAYIFSAGHEPILKLLRLNLNNNQLTVLQRLCVPLAWIEASPTLDVLIGFNDNHLVAWSHENDVLLQLQCGGGRRCWDYQLSSGILDIIYVKQKRVFHHRELLNNKLPGFFSHALRNKWHIRSCNILELIPMQNDAQPYIVSAGDDNIIKIHHLIGQSFIQCAELHTHISSVRHLVAHPLKSKNYSNSWAIFSVGGRAQLCINRLDPNGPVVNEICSHTLRSNCSGKNTLLDARLMQINVLQDTETEDFSLFVASSDGKIRLLHWQLENASQLLLLYLIDLKRCPLHLKFIKNLNLLLTTTTNGMLYGYDQTLCNMRFQIQLHAAGINAFDTLDDGSFLHILSGGDDETIKYTTIQVADMTVHKSVEFYGLHNAQVNALTLHSFKGIDQANKICAYTCSLDKQICMINLSTLRCSRIGYTCLSDINGMILEKNGRLYIYGCGLQVIALENE